MLPNASVTRLYPPSCHEDPHIDGNFSVVVSSVEVMKRAPFAAVLLLGFAACAAPVSRRAAVAPLPPTPAPPIAPTPVASVVPSAETPALEPEPPLAAPDEPLEPGDPNETVRACKVDTADAKKAQQAIDAIDAKVMALTADGDPKPVEAEIRRALHLPCLRLGLRDAPTLAADSGYALKQWWKDGGGRWWLRHYLELTIPRTPNSFPTSVVAPTVRRTLSLETRKKHPLRELLCSVQDAACGTETRGWSLRADDFFKRFAAAKRGHWLDGDQKSDAPPSVDVCIARARKGPAAARYVAWRHCLDEARPKVARFPIGAVKAPTRGWLLLRGRRGHYSFCDEVRAYDLATGAAYVAKSCSGLALVSDGSVDGAKTDDARKDETLVGTVPRDALREATWMMLLASEVQEDVVEAWGFALPVGVEPQRPPSEMGSSHSSFTVSSGQTRLAWSYMPDGASVSSSDLTWPEDYNHPGREHAVSLLRIAEAGFVAGCAPASPPATLDWGTAKSAVSPIDAKASTLRKVDQELEVALGKARSQACARK